MRLPQSVDDGFSEVVVCGGPTMLPATGIEKLPIIKFSKSDKSPMWTWRVVKRDPKLSDELFDEAVDDGGARCTKWRHFPLTSRNISCKILVPNYQLMVRLATNRIPLVASRHLELDRNKLIAANLRRCWLFLQYALWTPLLWSESTRICEIHSRTLLNSQLTSSSMVKSWFCESRVFTFKLMTIFVFFYFWKINVRWVTMLGLHWIFSLFIK